LNEGETKYRHRFTRFTGKSILHSAGSEFGSNFCSLFQMVEWSYGKGSQRNFLNEVSQLSFVKEVQLTKRETQVKSAVNKFYVPDTR
jgi:hypothetical protein